MASKLIIDNKTDLNYFEVVNLINRVIILKKDFMEKELPYSLIINIYRNEYLISFSLNKCSNKFLIQNN